MQDDIPLVQYCRALFTAWAEDFADIQRTVDRGMTFSTCTALRPPTQTPASETTKAASDSAKASTSSRAAASSQPTGGPTGVPTKWTAADQVAQIAHVEAHHPKIAFNKAFVRNLPDDKKHLLVEPTVGTS